MRGGAMRRPVSPASLDTAIARFCGAAIGCAQRCRQAAEFASGPISRLLSGSAVSSGRAIARIRPNTRGHVMPNSFAA
ncbi:hypothetical protein WU00_20310 [Burkholderia stagnalis]|nr:hypothetical protein WT05_10200 [Burkholderia stagnalis]KWE05749.1 hypothetical protein WT48_31000 [Burkholderia stagnalis]KWE09122.1 hypothetical protein WT47_12435 [Burkholderia stagnalis]KWO91733.1 hypothetical protein WU00_20310 [Burkholderia stagnalis]